MESMGGRVGSGEVSRGGVLELSSGATAMTFSNSSRLKRKEKGRRVERNGETER